MNDNLYIIIPYYNFSNNLYRTCNLIKLLECAKNDKNFYKCKIIIAEAYLEEIKENTKNNWNENEFLFNSSKILSYQPHDMVINIVDKQIEKTNELLFQFIDNKNFYHIKYPIPQKIWVKENLINLTVQKHLPKDWKYFCWIDGDVVFESDNWIQNTINSLDEFDIIQMFSMCFNQTVYKKNYHYGHYGYLYNQKKKYYNKITKEIAPTHTGYAWAMNRDFYEKIGGLWDINIIGSADSIIARSAIQDISEETVLNTNSLNVIYSPNYAKKLLEYYLKFKHCKYSYLDNHLFHLYHGDMEKRLYVERHQILFNYKYDHSFIDYNKDGILYLKNKNLQQEIEAYLINREN